MFELISLLAQQSSKQVAPSPKQPTDTAPVIQAKTTTLAQASVPSVAIPEAVPLNSQSNNQSAQTTLPPQPNTQQNTQQSRPSAATSEVSLPMFTPMAETLPTMNSSQPIGLNSLHQPSVTVSSASVPTNSPQDKATSDLGQQQSLPTIIVRANSSRANLLQSEQNGNQLQTPTIDKAEISKHSAQPKPLQVKPNLPKETIVEQSQLASNSAVPSELRSALIAPNRELVFNVTHLPSQQITESNRSLPVTPQVPKSVAEANAQLPSNPSSPSNGSRIERQKQLLEQHLADLVTNDRGGQPRQPQETRAQNQVQQQDDLVNQAYNYATQRRFDRARQVLKNPAISSDVRTQILSQIDDLERASRSLGVTNLKEPTSIQQRRAHQLRKLDPVALKPRPVQSAIPKQPLSRSPRSEIVIQVPQSGDPLSNTPLRPQPSTMQRDTPDANRVVDPSDLQAYRQTLSAVEQSPGAILYPLPKPAPVTSKFGWRTHPITRARRFHAGVDLGAAQGTPVLASRGGRVAVADRMGGYGLAIVLQHEDGTQDTLYAHLSQIFVRPGEEIQPGTVIGRVGSTGMSTGPHLHYEARRKEDTRWVAVDPGAHLEAARMRLVQARNSQGSRENEG
jgi:murein DD-endopeptidase MepM/ murein hydrolase activator NlpD